TTVIGVQLRLPPQRTRGIYIGLAIIPEHDLARRNAEVQSNCLEKAALGFLAAQLGRAIDAIEVGIKTHVRPHILHTIAFLIGGEIATNLMVARVLNRGQQPRIHLSLCIKPKLHKIIQRMRPAPLGQIGEQFNAQVSFTDKTICKRPTKELRGLCSNLRIVTLQGFGETPRLYQDAINVKNQNFYSHKLSLVVPSIILSLKNHSPSKSLRA